MQLKHLLTCCTIGLVVACNNHPKGEYIDLTSGKIIQVEKDKETGFMVNVDNKKPVYLSVNPSTKDTFMEEPGRRLTTML